MSAKTNALIGWDTSIAPFATFHSSTHVSWSKASDKYQASLYWFNFPAYA